MNVFAFAVHCVIPTGGLSTDLWAVVLLDSERITLDLYREVPGEMKSGMRSELIAGHFR
jgi:hypothetical protein